jgi:hypothetical protein
MSLTQTPPLSPAPSSIYPPSPVYAPSSVYSSRASSPSPSASPSLPSHSPSIGSSRSASSYQAAANRLRQQQNLGYTPFEYWKGPKPVLPGQKRFPIPQKRSSISQPLRRAATITVTATHRDGTLTAQQQRRPASTLSLYPLEKLQIDVNHLDHPALRGGSNDYNIMGWPRGGADPSGAGPASFNVRDSHGSTVELVTGSPPAYSASRDKTDMANTQQLWWDPRTWRKRIWAGIAAVVVIAIIAGVVAGVLVSKANRYPNYSKLNYTLQDTCKPSPAPPNYTGIQSISQSINQHITRLTPAAPPKKSILCLHITWHPTS